MTNQLNLLWHQEIHPLCLEEKLSACQTVHARQTHHTANGTEDLENIDPQIEEFISVDVNVPQNTKSFSSGQEKDYWDLELETKTSEGAVSDGGTCQNGIEQNGNMTQPQRWRFYNTSF